jgi:hypothetical protein
MRFEHLKTSHINQARVQAFFESNRDRWMSINELHSSLGIAKYLLRGYCHNLCRRKKILFNETRGEYPPINGVRQVRRYHLFMMPSGK